MFTNIKLKFLRHWDNNFRSTYVKFGIFNTIIVHRVKGMVNFLFSFLYKLDYIKYYMNLGTYVPMYIHM